MATDIAREQFERELSALVARFEKNRDDFLRADYPETETRTNFIDPFFAALGWDMRDERGLGREREVTREVSEKSGRPDYAFRLNNQKLFYVEAKSPHVPLERTEVILQVKRYAWSASVDLGIVTDFEEIRIYDTRVKPSRQEPDKGLICAFHYRDYRAPATLDVLWLLARAEVARGSLARLLEMSRVPQRQRKPVDLAFLDDLGEWRAQLAKFVFKLAPLESADLNSIVQVFLDRLIFIRVAEDRAILADDVATLQSIARRWSERATAVALGAELRAVFAHINARFNGDLFEPHACETIAWDVGADLVIQIIHALYEPYRFDVIPVELLGSIYERYLGKTIRVTDTRALVEEKPQVRKAGGVYYTPKPIVDYIVAQTVGKLIEGKTPEQIACIKILDPACGSGSFLLGAYQTLLDYHTRYYSTSANRRAPANDHQARLLRDSGVEYTVKLSLAQKAEILRNNLFGVDLDAQAVQITKLSLYIKMLEGERGAIMGQGVLPRLNENIKCGNSLIAHDIGKLPDQDGARIKPFTWESKTGFGKILANGGFDAVIGNPPYVRPHNLEFTDKEYFWKHYTTFVAKSDLYCCFLERAIALLKPDGRLGYIVSNGWLRLDSFEKLRELLIEKTTLLNIIDFTNYVFQQASVKTAILVLAKARRENSLVEVAMTKVVPDLLELRFKKISQDAFAQSYKHIFDLSLDEEQASIKNKMRARGVALGDNFEIAFGLKTGDDAKFLARSRRTAKYKPLLRGENVHRYSVSFANEFVWYAPAEMRAHRQTARPGTAERFEQPKVLVRDTGEGLQATFDDANYYVKDVLIVTDKNQDAAQLKYLTGMLNSTLMRFYYETSFPTLHVQRDELASLPIRAINFADAADRARHAHIIERVERMLELRAQLQATTSAVARERIEREIIVTDEHIDALVYELYGLTDEEIVIVARAETH